MTVQAAALLQEHFCEELQSQPDNAENELVRAMGAVVATQLGLPEEQLEVTVTELLEAEARVQFDVKITPECELSEVLAKVLTRILVAHCLVLTVQPVSGAGYPA